MKVSELAAELEVPASAVLAQCQRFGIDASWAGAELSGADVVVLRAELASTDPIDLTPTDPDPAAGAAGAAGSADSAGSADAERLPPTAVGSMPDLIEEVTPEPEPSALSDRSSLAPGFGRPGAATAAASHGAPQTAKNRQPTPTRARFEPAIRRAIVALAIAVAAYVGSNFVNLPILVGVLWLVAALALLVAVADSFRGRRHASTHPDRYRGIWVASITLVLAIAGIIGVTASVIGVVTDEPDDLPVGVADLASVQVGRWGYQRVMRLEENGWRQPTREVGTCWRVYDRRADRDEQRVEAADINLEDICGRVHTLEVLKVFAYNREADSPYPGPDGFARAGLVACGDQFKEIRADHPEATLKFEYPDGVGWDDGDHDVACVMITPERNGSLTG